MIAVAVLLIRVLVLVNGAFPQVLHRLHRHAAEAVLDGHPVLVALAETAHHVVFLLEREMGTKIRTKAVKILPRTKAPLGPF